MLNSTPPDAAFAGVIKDLAINTSGGMMKGNAQAYTSWLGRKSAMYQSPVMCAAMCAPTECEQSGDEQQKRIDAAQQHG